MIALLAVGKLHRLIRRMCYDDLVLLPNWHIAVEYLYLERGLPQYRVYCDETLIGVAHIRHPSRLPFVQRALAVHLVNVGCDPFVAVFLEGSALTPPTAKVRDLPVLKFPDVQKQGQGALTAMGSGLRFH